MTLSIRTVEAGDSVFEAIVAIVDRTAPEDPTSVEEMRWSEDTYPGTTYVLAEIDGRVIGAATVGRIYVHPPEYDAFWATVNVLPEARRQGAGSLLLDAAARAARAAGKGHLHVAAAADRPDAIAFLEHRGFAEFERSLAVRLDLARVDVPAPTVPDGIELTDLATRPDLVPGVHAVALEAYLDIPGGDQPIAAGDLTEFRARDVDRPGILPGGFVVAVERASGRVVGYASLLAKPGSPDVAFHDMTAVARGWRGQGLATALKRRTIAWAVANGLTALETGNDEDNHAMRAVNARLGYRPLPDSITMRGSVGAAMMTP